MAYQGINTGTGPNSGTGDTLLSGADKINSNFEELYTLLGNGSTLAVGIVTGIVAGDNVSVSSTFGTVTVSAATSGIVVTGPSTFIGLTTVTGDLYVSGDLYVADDIQYDEVNGRNLNISGVGTVATLGVTTNLTVSGVSTLGVTTFTGNVSVGSSFFFGDNNQVLMGAQDDFAIYHTDSEGNVLKTNVGNLNIIGDNANMVSLSGTAVVMATNVDSNFGVELYYNNQKKLDTKADGITVTGNVRSTKFIGDGADLVGITTLIQAGDNVTITTEAGITTISTAAGLTTANVSTNTLNVIGVATASAFVGDGSQLTNLPSGITTAVINADSINVSGLSTFTGNVSCGQSLLLGDNGKLLIGDAPDLQIYHDGDNSYIKDLIGTGALRLDSSFIELRNAVGDKRTATFSSGTGANGGAQLYFDGTKRYETTSTGGVVSGILTATEFFGDGSNLTGVGGGNTANVSTNTLNVIGVTTTGTVLVTGETSGGSTTNYTEVTLSNTAGFDNSYSAQSSGFVLDTGAVTSGSAQFKADSNYYYYVADSGPQADGRIIIFSEVDNAWFALVVIGANFTEGNVSNDQALGFAAGTESLTASSETGDGRNVPQSSADIVYTTSGGGSTTGVGVTMRPDGDAIFAGVVTATSFRGDGSQLTGVGGGNTANVSTNTLNVIGVTTTSDINISGIVTAGIGTIRSLRVGAGVGPSAPNGQLAVVNASGVAAFTVGQNVDGSGQNHLGFYYNGPAAPVAAQMFTSNGRLRFVTDGGGGGALPLAQQSGFQFGVNGNFSNLPLVAIHDVSAAAGVATAFVVNGSTLLNDGLNVTGVTTANSFEGNGSNLVSGRWVLGANGTNDYTFTGIGFTETTNDPDIYLARGSVYEFVNNMGAHPFRIQSTPNGSTGTIYNNGVTNNDASNGTVRFEVTMNAPNTLYYQCTAHPNMGGTIYIYPELR